MSALERLERIAQRLEGASELAAPSRSVGYLAAAAVVRSQIRSGRRGEELNRYRLERVLEASERLADSAPSDSEEQRLADGSTLRLEGLREALAA